MPKIVNLVIIVIVAISIGVTLAVQKTSNPLLQEIIEQQKEIMKNQKTLEGQLAQAGFMAQEDPNGSQSLSARVAALDTKITNFLKLLLEGPPGQGQQAPMPPQEDFSKVYDIPVGPSAVRGEQNAPITIVEFIDFQCPFCTRFHPVLNEILTAYPGKVKYMAKNFPLQFHPQARPAAKAALAAGEQGKYWEMAEALFANNRMLTEDKFKELAKSLGLNVEKFLKDYKDKDAQWEKIIEDDLALGGRVDVRGTPTFYLNGRKTMARDLAAFKGEIDSILNPKE